MASEIKNRAKEIVSDAVLKKKSDSSQSYRLFLEWLALRPLVIVSLLLCAGVAFAAYRVYVTPRGEITAPGEGSRTQQVVEIEGFTKNIPAEHQYLWIAVDIPSLGHCWPKRQIYSINGDFKTKILERGPNTEFKVSLYAVPRNIHQDILEWVKECQETKVETGFRMIPDDFRLDSIILRLDTT